MKKIVMALLLVFSPVISMTPDDLINSINEFIKQLEKEEKEKIKIANKAIGGDKSNDKNIIIK